MPAFVIHLRSQHARWEDPYGAREGVREAQSLLKVAEKLPEKYIRLENKQSARQRLQGHCRSRHCMYSVVIEMTKPSAGYLHFVFVSLEIA